LTRRGTVWKDVVGFPNYEVNEYGEIYSKSTNRKLIGTFYKNKRVRVVLRYNNESYIKYIYQVVAEAFLEPSPGPEYWLDHIDGDIYNVEPDNLEWTKNGYNRLRGNGRTIRILENGKHFNTALAAAEYLDVHPSSVSKHLHGHLPAVKGYHLEYVG